MTSSDPGMVRFGGFELDPTTGELWRDGEPVDLPPQPARLLALLARKPGRIVSRERIRETVWGDTVIEFDQAINNAVRQVRNVLGDDASDPRFIETVPRRGYRFIASVDPVRPDEGPDGRSDGEAYLPGTEAEGGEAATNPTRRWSPVRYGGLLAVAIGIVVAIWIGLDAGADDREIVLAVVPARATILGSPSEAVADTLTPLFITALSGMEHRGLRVIPWRWDMTLDRETGRAMRDGELVDVDVLLEANVYEEPAGMEVSVTLTALPGGVQLWHRRMEGLTGDPAVIADEVAKAVVVAVGDRISPAAYR